MSTGDSNRTSGNKTLAKAAVWLIRWILKAVSKRYTKLFVLCNVACFVEAWAKVAKGKPVDSSTRLYVELDEAISFYMFKDGLLRQDYGSFESSILYWHYANKILNKFSPEKIRSIYRFVLHHRIADLLAEYRNVSNYLSFRATKDLNKLESALGEEASSDYWRARFKRARLPVMFRSEPNLWRISWYLKSRINKNKRELARGNYIKYDFSFSELASLVAILGTLAFLLGYLRVMIVFSHFGISYENYFTISDYLSASVAALSAYFPIVILVFFL